LGVFIVCVLLLWFVGSVLQMRDTIRGILLTQIGIIYLIPVLSIYLSKLDVQKTLFFHRPKVAHLAIALILGIAAQPLANKIVELQFLVLPGSQISAEAVQKIITPLLEYNILIPIAVFALSAGVCEEILTRGYMLSAFKSRYGASKGMILCAFAFGILHLNIFQIPYAFFLGLVAGYLVIRTGSIFPAMVFHFTNNAFAIINGKYRYAESLIKYINENAHWLANISEKEFLPWYIYVPAILITAVLIIVLRRTSKKT